MRRTLAITAAAITLAACATARAPVVEDPPFTWTFEEVGGGEVVLYFGDAGTDNVGLGFRCRGGSGKVTFSSVLGEDYARTGKGQASWSTTVRLSSGAQKRSYPARAERGAPEPIVTAETRLDDPVLKAFAQTGRIVIERYPQYASTAGDLAAIRRFMDACAGQRGS